MATESDGLLLGHCADCEAPVPTDQLLITYTTEDGWPRMYAECPACREIVRPV